MRTGDQAHRLSWNFVGQNSNGLVFNCRRSPRVKPDGALRRSRRDGSDRLEGGGGGGGKIRRVGVADGVMVGRSARKLAAGLWHLAAARNSGSGGMTWHRRHGGPSNQLQFLPDSAMRIPKAGMEGATKWDHYFLNKGPAEVCHFHSHSRLLKHQQVATTSAAYALQAELIRARNRIKQLETERHSFKKKLTQFLRRINRERASSTQRERKKVFVIIDHLKGRLQRERRSCERMEIENSKLLSDLADAKLSAKQYIQEFRKEKKRRDLLEDVCHELGKDIEEHKEKVRAMKMECSRIQEEVEEERKMMQMAEVWREERVQMKLVDAKLILEEKYFQTNSLIGDLEALLRSNGASYDVIKVSEAMNSLRIRDVTELSHMPQISDETGVDDECRNLLPDDGHSKFDNVSPEANESTKTLVCVNSGHGLDHEKSSVGPSRFRETLIRASGDDRNANQESLNPKTDGISPGEKLKNKGASVRKLWKFTPNAADVLKTITIGENARLSEGSNSSIITVSPELVPEEGLDGNEQVSHWCLPGQRNPHISRAMRGCIEWPRGIQKHGSKAKLLEASIGGGKALLRNPLRERLK